MRSSSGSEVSSEIALKRVLPAAGSPENEPRLPDGAISELARIRAKDAALGDESAWNYMTPTERRLAADRRFLLTLTGRLER